MTNDGGPAFPVNDFHRADNFTHPGMSLRDWFAGMAMRLFSWSTDDLPNAANLCYQVADAMLAARKQSEPETNR